MVAVVGACGGGDEAVTFVHVAVGLRLPFANQTNRQDTSNLLDSL